ncbi:MAG: hypothetical protein HFJ65_07710 [Eggerthellaceae bacterium]|nr:hypothetical protein [Eggerthellaceae bacterium]
MPFANIMKRTSYIAAAALLALALGLVGCANQQAQEPAEEEQTTSRSFMADMNQAAADLSEKMTAFTDAVAREDLVSMQTQADSAYAVINRISEIEAPEELGELKQKYVDGANQLKDAMSSYIDLYTEIDTATTRDPFDYDTYNDRISQIQAAYDAGIQTIKDADQSATEM